MADIPSQTDQPEQQRWSSITSRRDRAGEATRMFITHVRHYLSSLPLISLLTIIIPLFTNLLDVITLIGPTQDMLLYESLCLSITRIMNNFEVYRLFLYPLVHANTTLLVTNLILLIPYISAHERKKGSLFVLFELVCLYTILPGIIYLLVISLLTTVTTIGAYVGTIASSGLSVWTVGLSLWTMLDGDTTNHSLFGVIPLPAKAIPFLIIGFYFFLVPDSSVILHLVAAGIGYLYFNHRLPAILTPTNEKCRQYEDLRWTNLLTKHPKFVSVDTAGDGYLPVSSVNNHRVASTTPYTVNTQQSGSPSNFPGQGYTLSDN
ncbi:hypothetical protein BC941DRAFT_467872 [Chlamydoabsidia padenii]|nr:hypothetical protein BC941DRAFT_467872 [Chlamydoabsidia padenii]